MDENKARVCFQTLLVYLEEQWNRSVREKSILQGPDFSGMRDYLLVGQTCYKLGLIVIVEYITCYICIIRFFFLETLSGQATRFGHNSL